MTAGRRGRCDGDALGSPRHPGHAGRHVRTGGRSQPGSGALSSSRSLRSLADCPAALEPASSPHRAQTTPRCTSCWKPVWPPQAASGCGSPRCRAGETLCRTQGRTPGRQSQDALRALRLAPLPGQWRPAARGPRRGPPVVFWAKGLELWMDVALRPAFQELRSPRGRTALENAKFIWSLKGHSRLDSRARKPVEHPAECGADVGEGPRKVWTLQALAGGLLCSGPLPTAQAIGPTSPHAQRDRGRAVRPRVPLRPAQPTHPQRRRPRTRRSTGQQAR